MLKNRGEIHEFQYEPKEFWFWSIKRGTRFYKPDYAVWDDEGAVPYFYEVKGVMDSVSRIKLERMAKYYPDVVVLIIDERRYNEIEREFGPQIEKWEWKP
jgi:zona occludens toxin (predicted ATPase)